MSNVASLSDARAAKAAASFNPTRLPTSADDVLVGKTYRAKLTAELVGKLPPAPRGLYVVKAEGVRGLELRVTKEAKTFYVRARMGNRDDGNNRAKPVRVGTLAELGKWQNMMDTASTLYGDVRTNGRDFNAEREAARVVFKRASKRPADYLEGFLSRPAHHGEGPLRPESVRNYRYALSAFLGDAMNQPMDTITPDVVCKLYEAAVTAVGKATARNGLKALRAMQNWAEIANTTGKAFKKFPHARTKGGAKPSRISMEQAPALCEWLIAYRANVEAGSARFHHADLMVLAMLTGLRARTLRALRWEWLDLTRGLLKVPAYWMKNNKEAHLPVSARALDLLNGRRAANPKGELVFPAQRNKAKSMGKCTEFFQELPWRCGPHDARKVFATILANHPGVPYAVVKGLMTHTGGDDITFKHYLTLDPAVMRSGADAVAGMLFPG